MPKLTEQQRQAIRDRRKPPPPTTRLGSGRKPTKPVKVYHLFRGPRGFSPKTRYYDGQDVAVSATSLRQAMALAYKSKWIDPNDDYPLGVMSQYTRDQGYDLWCGCQGHWCSAGEPRHGKGITEIRRAIRSHNCTDDPNDAQGGHS